MANGPHFEEIAARIEALVNEGKLEVQGALSRWHYSEVRVVEPGYARHTVQGLMRRLEMTAGTAESRAFVRSPKNGFGRICRSRSMLIDSISAVTYALRYNCAGSGEECRASIQ